MKTRYMFPLLLLVSMVLGCSLLAARQAPPGESPSWWQVELRISVNGEYAYVMNNKGFDGNYSFTAVILGTLQEDGEDYIFLQAYREIQEMKWKERTFNQSGRRESDLSKKIKPGVTVNYVFHEKGLLSFDFDFKPVHVPAAGAIFPKPVKHLRFPASAGDDPVLSRADYNKGITHGSNRVVLDRKDIYNQKEIIREFAWQWQERNPLAVSGAAANKNRHNAHRVETRLKMIRPAKKEQKPL